VTSIPNLPVYLSLDLGGEYATFYGNVNASLEFTKPRLETDRIGYGGILVYVPLFDAFGQYVAFDMACPHEVDRNIRVHHDGNGNAVCEKCGSAFLLVDGTGVRTSGPAKENLKRYRADLRLTNTSRKLIITR
jgi:nitrite reductase/ring-hydroxylating ferredoxin subunit